MTNVIQFPRGAAFYPQDELQILEAMEARKHFFLAHDYADKQCEEKHWFLNEYYWLFYGRYLKKYTNYLREYYEENNVWFYNKLWSKLSPSISSDTILEIHYLSKCHRGAYLTPEQIRALEIIKLTLDELKEELN